MCRSPVRVLVVLGLLVGPAPGSLAARGARVVVQVSPARSIEDQPVALRVSGLRARERVAIGLRSRDGEGFVWASRAVFAAGRDGVVDVNRAPSIGGSYRGVWPMGLIASMTPVKQPADRGYDWGRGADLFHVTISAVGHVVASTSFRRSWGMPFSVRSETVQSAGFVGTFFAPRTATRHTSLLTLGGSEGGNSTQLLAARLAADGYPTLALAYFDAPGLPRALTNIPLEYFRHALQWLADQPPVDPKRIVVDGFSRGTQAALLLAVYYPQLVHGVIAASPLNVNACGSHGLSGPPGCIGPAFTLDRKPLPYTKQWDNPYPTDMPAAIIPVERIKVPLLLACAEDDTDWVSCESAHAIIHRLAAKRSSAQHYVYAYLNGGHLIGRQVPDQPGMMAFDSDIPQGEQTREHLWPHILAFLRRI